MFIDISAKEDSKSKGVVKIRGDSLYNNNARAGALLIKSRCI